MTSGPCECEHVTHLMHDEERIAHPYAQHCDSIRHLCTEWGTFKVCTVCADTHLSKWEISSSHERCHERCHERVHFRLIVTPCCGHMLCWVNPRFPTYCPECGKFIYDEVKGHVTLSDNNATLTHLSKSRT